MHVASSPLVANKDALLKLLTSALTHTEPTLRGVAIKTFGILFQMGGALERSEVSSNKYYIVWLCDVFVFFADVDFLRAVEGDSSNRPGLFSEVS